MKKDLKFEEALEMLDEEVKKLEAGNLSIDDSLAAYERAVGLVKICNERLETAESRVRMLTENDDGTVTDIPFGGADDEA